MVKSQARRLVPGSNFSRLVQALIRVSCTRSSASDPLWLRDQAKARSAGINATTSSRQLDVPVITPSIRFRRQGGLHSASPALGEREAHVSVPAPGPLESSLFSERCWTPRWRRSFECLGLALRERRVRVPGAQRRHMAQSERGLLTRPSLDDVLAYRAHVDGAMGRLLADGAGDFADLLDLGLAHEEQHQELILMDILHLFAQSPLQPAYAPPRTQPNPPPEPLRFVGFEGGLVQIGHSGEGFAFDNEGPCHRVWLEPFELADRLVTN